MRAMIAMAALVLAGCAGNKPGVAYVRAHPELDAETKRRIIAREVVEGMTMEQALVALGGPSEVRRNADGTEFWDYRSAVLIFKDGVLASWVDKKTLY